VTDRIHLGISTCPNDTFAFHALLAGESDFHGLAFDVELLDVQELNEGMLAGRWDVAKVSFHAALAMAERVAVLPAGSALGFGVGPLVLAPSDEPGREPLHVLCPGEWTTATLLWRIFHPEPVRLEQRVFSEIMPALARGEADRGVCIHEGRFTWADQGLHLVEDLGTTWEDATGTALPLGGIVARLGLSPAVLSRVADAVRDSIRWGLEHREACLPTMRAHAQEQADDVLWRHMELYVNERTLDLGSEGRRALSLLQERASEHLPSAVPPLVVLGGE